MIYYTIIKTPIGELELVRDKQNLLKIQLPNEKLNKEELNISFPNREIIETNSGFEDVVQQLNEYFNGNRKHFNINYKLNISQFYKNALMEVSKVPYGNTSTYSAIAQKLNNPKAVRAVGTANAKNPIPIIIPCHRIINSNGKLGGYAGGLDMKNQLLKFEKNNN